MKRTLTLISIIIGIASNAQWTTYDVSNSNISSNQCQRVVVDPSNGDILVGTSAGFNVKSGSTWALHDVASGALANNIAVISLRDGNNLWVTTDGGGVSRYNGSSWTIFNTGNSAIADDRIYNLVKAPNGILWFGTRDGGLCSYNGTTFTTISISSNVTVNYDRVMGMDIDGNGVIWIGSAGGGLVKYNPSTNQWAQYSTSNSTILDNDVYTITCGPDGNIWAGTFDGLSIFNLNTSTFTTHLSTANSIMPANYIRGISFDGIGRAYVAMGWGGVARVETNYTISTIWTSSNSNLPSDTIQHLYYGNGQLWVASLTEGLASLDIDVSVNELRGFSLNLNAYPVPSCGDVTLEIATEKNNEVEIAVFSVNGQQVWNKKSVQLVANSVQRIVIPMAEHAQGSYMIVVTDTEGTQHSRQIIKE